MIKSHFYHDLSTCQISICSLLLSFYLAASHVKMTVPHVNNNVRRIPHDIILHLHSCNNACVEEEPRSPGQEEDH